MQIFAAIKFASNNPIMIIKICVRIFNVEWLGCGIIILINNLSTLFLCYENNLLDKEKYK